MTCRGSSGGSGMGRAGTGPGIRLAAVLLCLWALPAAAGASIEVDGSDPACDDTSGQPVFCNLAPAVAVAATGDEILLAAGSYSGPGNREIDLTGTLVIRGAGIGETVLDAGAAGYLFSMDAEPGDEWHLTVADLTLINGAASGAAVRVSDSALTLRRVVMRANAGGAVRVSNGDLYIDESGFFDNTATQGGAVHLSAFLFNLPPEDHPEARIANSVFQGNQAGQGGALWLDTSSNTSFGDYRVVNSTFSGNSAQTGGAILANDQAGLTLDFVTFHGNQGDDGATAFFNNAPVRVSHTVFAGPGPLCGFLPSFGGESQGYNLAEDDTCQALLDHPSDLNETPAGLAPLADNGGLTLTHAPQMGSAVIDTGASACIGSDGGAVLRDQRNAPRPFDAACDRGAVESGSTPGAAQGLSTVAVPIFHPAGLAALCLLLMLAGLRIISR